MYIKALRSARESRRARVVVVVVVYVCVCQHAYKQQHLASDHVGFLRDDLQAYQHAYRNARRVDWRAHARAPKVCTPFAWAGRTRSSSRAAAVAAEGITKMCPAHSRTYYIVYTCACSPRSHYMCACAERSRELARARARTKGMCLKPCTHTRALVRHDTKPLHDCATVDGRRSVGRSVRSTDRPTGRNSEPKNNEKKTTL